MQIIVRTAQLWPQNISCLFTVNFCETVLQHGSQGENHQYNNSKNAL